MGGYDISERMLEDHHDVFADIWNVCAFGGEEIIDPDELVDSTARSSFKADDTVLHEQERDVVKYWQRTMMRIASLGIENQTQVDNDMPLRIMSYDGASYKQQMLDGKERYPVLSMVLYFGIERPWSGPLDLKSCFEVPQAIDALVNDYRISVVNVAFLSDKELSLFKSDFGIVADHFCQMRRGTSYKPSRNRIRHVDATLQLLRVMTGDRRYEELLTAEEKRGGRATMDLVLERYWNDGLAKGEARGIALGEARGIIGMGRRFNIPERDIIDQLVSQTRCSEEEAARLLREADAARS